jgi:delta-aminolevulinic acid dehydratase/porphobilinogen synthase
MTLLDPTSVLPNFQRTRRLRTTSAIRDFVRETELRPHDFVLLHRRP